MHFNIAPPLTTACVLALFKLGCRTVGTRADFMICVCPLTLSYSWDSLTLLSHEQHRIAIRIVPGGSTCGSTQTILKYTTQHKVGILSRRQVAVMYFNMIAHIGLGLPLLATAPQFPVNPHLW